MQLRLIHTDVLVVAVVRMSIPLAFALVSDSLSTRAMHQPAVSRRVAYYYSLRKESVMVVPVPYAGL